MFMRLMTGGGFGLLLLAGGVLAAPAAAHEAHKATADVPKSVGPKAVEPKALGMPWNERDFAFAAPPPGSYQLPPLKTAPDGELLAADGRPVRLSQELAGRVALVSFIYTRCSDAHGCPLALAVFSTIEAAAALDPQLAANLRLTAISFDPDHDSPPVMAELLRREAAHADKVAWSALTARDRDRIRPILDGFGQYVVPDIDAEGKPLGTFSHVLKVFLIDRAGRIRNIYSADFLDPRLVVNDVHTLLLEEAAIAGR